MGLGIPGTARHVATPISRFLALLGVLRQPENASAWPGINGVLGVEGDAVPGDLPQTSAAIAACYRLPLYKETNMLRINLSKSALVLLPLFATSLSGYGLTQSVSEGTRSAVSSLFYKKITVLRLDFTAREALNTDARENPSSPQAVVIRIYQLRDRKTFDSLVYSQRLSDGDALLKDDLLASREVVLHPGSAASQTMPMASEAKFVAVVALFRQPDRAGGCWQQVLEREGLDPNKARVLEASEHCLTLLPQKGE